MSNSNGSVIIKELTNGLTIVLDRVPEVNTTAYSLLIPGGISADDPNLVGGALILSDLLSKGAGNKDAKELVNSYDYHAINHAEFASSVNFGLQGSCLHDKLDIALLLLADLVLRPTLPENYIAPVASLLLQDLESLSDNPSRWCLIELGMRYYPDPFGRSPIGTIEGIKSSNIDTIRDLYERSFKPKGSVLSIAGNFHAANLLEKLETLFRDWKGQALERPKFKGLKPFENHFIKKESNQTQIALAFPAPKYGDTDYYTSKVANQIMSGGMFGRLFLEVREKQGLCYSVYSRNSAGREYGTTLVYAGTTPERAATTLSTILKQFEIVAGNIDDEELVRAKANLLSSLLLSEDSVSSRAVSNGSEWWLGERVRSLGEIEQAIMKVSKLDLESYFQKYQPLNYTQLVVGTNSL